jgi:hypothetical protein
VGVSSFHQFYNNSFRARVQMIGSAAASIRKINIINNFSCLSGFFSV